MLPQDTLIWVFHFFIEVKHMDFDDTKMIDNVIKNSNVVINLVGKFLS